MVTCHLCRCHGDTCFPGYLVIPLQVSLGMSVPRTKITVSTSDTRFPRTHFSAFPVNIDNIDIQSARNCLMALVSRGQTAFSSLIFEKAVWLRQTIMALILV